MIVDSTRKGKRFPDSMSKTIPIWTCVLNRAIHNYRMALGGLQASENDLNGSGQDSTYWDCSLHLPLWVSQTEKLMIEIRLEGWTKELEASGADIASVASTLKKPLRPLWISQKTVIWLNEVPDYDSWAFTPIILVSASSSSGNFQRHTTSEFSWNYIAGAGDDEESWSRGLRPDLFWKHAHDVIRSDPASCNQKIADIVEKDRVRRAQRGENAPQVSVRPSKLVTESKFPAERPLDLDTTTIIENEQLSGEVYLCWLGSTNIAVCRTQPAMEVDPDVCILHCDKEYSVSPKNSEFHLHLPILDSKYDRFSLLRHLPSALNFSQTRLREGRKLLVCCQNGEDMSICICLAILTLLYDEAGNLDDGKSFNDSLISKSELRRRLVFICKYAVNARPSRGNLKQVFNYLNERRYGQPPSVS
ncbi:tRNA A64-2'-O-ribosylphosphate transferase isoform X2 [Henckelia pumila]